MHVREEDGKLFSVSKIKGLDNVELVEATYEEFREDNT